MTTVVGKVEKLAGYLNISVEELKQSLNPSLVLNGVTTLDEACEVYDKAPSGSELKEAALVKITEIGMTLLATATLELDEAYEVYNKAPSGSELKKVALAKMLELV